ncbi:hypothetical protein SBA4_4120015 [Candidatus Sulfopaludibacter sp. SbA4]|nr:hypothetical protein SBA4_4120015 [Candidatus Sulfopaludibacter sp. SbA4]
MAESDVAGVCGFSPLHEGDTSVASPHVSGTAASPMFQSPSRGGHLRGAGFGGGGDFRSVGFSPLHEGDTSVADHPFPMDRNRLSFSPLHEGDTSVAPCPVCMWRGI